jgi:hypothetical protein
LLSEPVQDSEHGRTRTRDLELRRAEPEPGPAGAGAAVPRAEVKRDFGSDRLARPESEPDSLPPDSERPAAAGAPGPLARAAMVTSHGHGPGPGPGPGPDGWPGPLPGRDSVGGSEAQMLGSCYGASAGPRPARPSQGTYLFIFQ